MRMRDELVRQSERVKKPRPAIAGWEALDKGPEVVSGSARYRLSVFKIFDFLQVIDGFYNRCPFYAAKQYPKPPFIDVFVRNIPI
jgi:hypothetical protein